MTVTNFYLAIIIGTLISLLVDELFGIQCGGLIVPGYLAMVIDDIPLHPARFCNQLHRLRHRELCSSEIHDSVRKAQICSDAASRNFSEACC